MRTAGRAILAAQPQMEFTTTRVVPFSFSFSSTSPADLSSSKPIWVSSARIGCTSSSGYMPADIGRRMTCNLKAVDVEIVVPDEGEDRRLRNHEVALAFECDLDGRLTEEQRVVADLCLHRDKARLAR